MNTHGDVLRVPYYVMLLRVDSIAPVLRKPLEVNAQH